MSKLPDFILALFAAYVVLATLAMAWELLLP